MKTILTNLIAICMVVLILTHCQSTDKLIENKLYDRAIEQLVQKVSSGKTDDKTLRSLSEAYHAANQLDHDRIQFLRKSGQPESCIELFERYSAIDARQNLVKQLPETVLKQMNIVPLDLKPQIAEYNIKSQRYLFAKAGELQKTGVKKDAKTAYDLLVKLKTMNPTYPGIDDLLRQAILNSASNILITIKNNTPIYLSKEEIHRMLNFSKEELQQPNTIYYLDNEENIVYDYIFVIRLKSIVVSPERTANRTYTEKKQIGDKPMQTAIVNEVNMSKSCEMKASVDIVETVENEMILTTPVNVVSNFNYTYASVKGEIQAVSEQTEMNLNRSAIPFPSDILLVQDASKRLNLLIKKVVFKSKTEQKIDD